MKNSSIRFLLILAMILPWGGVVHAAPIPVPFPGEVAQKLYARHLKHPRSLFWRKTMLTPELYMALRREYWQRSVDKLMRRPVHLGFDPFTGEQSLPSEYRILSKELMDRTASVTMEMTWADRPKDPLRTVVLKFQRIGKLWYVSDIVTSEGSLLGFLSLNDK